MSEQKLCPTCGGTHSCDHFAKFPNSESISQATREEWARRIATLIPISHYSTTELYEQKFAKVVERVLALMTNEGKI